MMTRARLAGLAPQVGPGVSIEKIYVSWTESWDLDRYVEHYLRERVRGREREARAVVLRIIARYPGDAPVTKSNMDYFLDANLPRKAGGRLPRSLRLLLP